ncbi:single stranded DNA-binding protein [Bacillus phage vB_BsuP-Goe22]|uniref:Single-stranded DNA-binding protein n=3 Tax=Salasvirus TaxID=186846 RepID=SSB_BPPZA|nr:single strand DNA binding protein [Bacillus phage PZA]P06953.1 RecName: Full=Single-stranded DNA-binding protein; Short=SSB; AltName: Full=Gene product 5; Short=gp5; AltName: Full=Protein p5 [Bacillus phage PZA]AYJ76459.1 putative single stranded DNA-binding protein [Bacillus phage BSP4]AYJ76483.1 putative single stranded DNA-binding protein [Bacillus phage BSP2]QQO90040.1 single-stranded DNA-binding protein [Bacillus phage BSTP4]QRD99286.1 ssDNA binding protein [Bacillus phage Whiting18]U
MENTNIVKATFDTETLEGQIKIFNAQTGGGQSFKNLPDGTIIEATAIAQYKQVSDTYGDAKEETVTTIFAADGSLYSAISKTVAEAASDLIDLVTRHKLETFKVKVVQGTSSKGNVFFSLQLSL